uniref:leucine-rich repeat domain-containing protein n=1 Tax=Acetatifactor sp. TaxID=1872090 RepID=UPI004057837F
MEKRNRVLQIVSIILCVFMLCVSASQNVGGFVQITDESTALSGSVGTLITEGEADICVIPDKYNTGAQGELTPVTSECYISGVKFGTTGATDRKLDLYYQSVEVPSTIVVENYDFSASDFKVYNVAKVEKEVTVIFRNCKFQSYTISGSGKVTHQFENCTFTHFAGSDSTFTNCYFGGGTDGDGINPMANCTFTNCMIADLVQSAEVAGDKHIDGFQIFGSTTGTNNTNIHLNNCRFEMPYIPFSAPSGALNCPLSIIMRYSDADNVTFEDCYINGGLYYSLMVLANGNSVTNVSFKNIHLGETSKSAYSCDAEFKTMLASNVSVTNKLYVASVRKMSDGIHLSVTNDTNEERTLSVLTETGIEEFKIPACPKGMDLVTDTVTYSDFPFDMDIVIPNTEWVVCYDTTGSAEQIRFVNWSGKDIYADVDTLFPEEVKNMGTIIIGSVPAVSTQVSNSSSQVPEEKEDNGTDSDVTGTAMEGTCGDDIRYILSNGVLTLSGTGVTNNYHSGSTAPWYEYRTEIKEVVVCEGITGIGNQLFVDCINLEQVTLAESVTTIGSNVFKRCNSMKQIYVPKSLQKIGNRCFSSSVETVVYSGSEEEWKEISFGSYNDGLLNADITFSEYVLYSGMCGDDVAWTYSSKGTLRLYGTGPTYNYHSGNTAPWFSYASEINNIVIEEGVTAIGNYIFRDCARVEKVDLPGTVTAIGVNSFSRCKGLSELTCTASLNSMGKNSFAATKISVVYFTGSVSDWNAISGNSLTTATVVYQ